VRRLILLLPLVIVFGAPASARAGGWATTAIDEPPTDLRAGEPWRLRIHIRQHGVTPLAGLEPSVRITRDDGAHRDFAARPGAGPGEYVAEVRFPTAGHWRYRIFDGFTDAWPHTFPAVTVAPASGAAGGGDALPWPQLLAVAAVALLWSGGWLYWAWPVGARRRRRRPARPGAVTLPG
jgi:hypothetical protein